MKTVYGPVSSWRLGKSLGIDIICSKEKICSFDCNYCQLGKNSNKTKIRKNFIQIEKMKKDLSEALKITKPDVITFSGTGETTLAMNIDIAIDTIRKISNLPLAILTNSSLMNKDNIRNVLKNLDIVVAKLDASNEKTFQKINQPANDIKLNDIIDGIKKFKKIFKGKLAIQIMFTSDNIQFVDDIIKIVEDINPNEVQINTPLRVCPVKPLTKSQINNIETKFKKKELNSISVYNSIKPKTNPLDKMELFYRGRIKK